MQDSLKNLVLVGETSREFTPVANRQCVGCRLLQLFPPKVDGAAIHGAYFSTDETLNLMRYILRGLDRGVQETLGYIASRVAKAAVSKNAYPTLTQNRNR